MKTHPNPILVHRRIRASIRGGALITVIIVTTVVSMIVASLLQWGVSDQKVNVRHFALLDARNAAEAAAELGAGILAYRWESQTSVPSDDLETHPLDEEEAFLDELPATFPDTRYEFELTGGSVERGRFYIHPDDPAFSDDPHKGKLVTVQSVDILSKATVEEPLLSDSVSAYARLTLQVRDAPLFSHAVFYNMDLEFHPGPQMVMNGPVHANGDIWMQAVNRLEFTSNVTATGDFRYGSMNRAHTSNPVDQNGKVFINNGEGGLASPYRGSGNRRNIRSYWDSQSPQEYFTSEGYTNWGDFAMNRWNGNLQDAAHEVPSLNPIGFNDYVRDDPSTPSIVDDDLNYAYALIEPNIVQATDPSGLQNPVHKGAGEKEKFAYKAGLIVKVHYSEDGINTSDGGTLPGPDYRIRLRERLPTPREDRDNIDDPLDPNSVWNNLYGQYDGREQADSLEEALGPESDFYISFWKVDRDDAHNLSTTNFNETTVQAVDPDGSPRYNDDGTPEKVTVQTVREVPLKVSLDWEWQKRDIHDMFAVHQYREFENAQGGGGNNGNNNGNRGNNGDNGNDDNNGVDDDFLNEDTGTPGDPRSSMYDHRRQTGVDLVEMNMDKFRIYVEHSGMGGVLSAYDWSTPEENRYSPDQDFNGVLYVEFPTDPETIPGSGDYEARPDGIVKSQRKSPRDEDVELGLIVTNANRIPDPYYNKASGRDPGFTLATNTPVYIKGHYNADGASNTGTNTEADESSVWDPNPPAAIVADAVMPLSSGFGFLGTRDRSADASGFTEFNAAIIQGLRPTDKEGDGDQSGGNHNFPRFLEDWGGIEFRYRGSMVALFESEIATQGTSTRYYSPPKRNWGFYELFQDGVFPPGTPNVRSFKKINFRFITQAEYEKALKEI